MSFNFLFSSFSFSINPSCSIFLFFLNSFPSLQYYFLHPFLSLPPLSLSLSLSQRSCPELCSKHHSSSVLLPDRPTVRLFFLYLLSNPLNVYFIVPLQFDTVADCVEISNVILKSYTVYTEVGDCELVWVPLYACVFRLCMHVLCVCVLIIILRWLDYLGFSW